MKNGVRVTAPAKINLFLGVHRELDERSYHRVDSVMCYVDVMDVVTLVVSDSLMLSCTPPLDASYHKNNCIRAARAMGETFQRDPNFNITIERHIPVRAGLGGSSTDAAATILGICHLWGLDPADPRCFKVARSVGADVPFFLSGVPTYLDGAGDEIAETFPPLSDVPLVVLNLIPEGEGATTQEVYEEFDRLSVAAGSPEGVCAALRSRTLTHLPELIENNLEPIAERISPDVLALRTWLNSRKAVLRAMVSGSGSSVFGLCASDEDAQSIAQEAKCYGFWAHAGSILNHGPEVYPL